MNSLIDERYEGCHTSQDLTLRLKGSLEGKDYNEKISCVITRDEDGNIIEDTGLRYYYDGYHYRPTHIPEEKGQNGRPRLYQEVVYVLIDFLYYNDYEQELFEMEEGETTTFDHQVKNTGLELLDQNEEFPIEVTCTLLARLKE